MLDTATIAPSATNPNAAPGWASLRNVRTWPSTRKYLVALLVLFLAKQAFTVIALPPFTGHDEVAHFAYIETVSNEHRLPVIPDLEDWRASWEARTTPPGDYLPDSLYRYCRYVLDWNYCDEPRWANNPPRGVTVGGALYPHGWQYAANHPPLYYALMSPVFAATKQLSLETQQYILRAAVIPIGVLVIVLTYLIAGVLFPRDRLVRTVAPTFVAFQTQVSYEAAMVNHDILLVAMFTALVYLLIRGIRNGFTLQSAAVTGLTLGLGMLSKASMLSATPLIAAAIIIAVGVRHVRRWVTLGAVVIFVAALVSWPWYAFLYRTYGNLSGLEQIKALQYNWAYKFDDAPSILDQFWNSGFARMRWNETWGEFGWRLIHLDDWLLVAIGIPLLILAVAAIAALVVASLRLRSDRPRGRFSLSREQVSGLWLLLATCVVAYGAMLQFGTDFKLTQARYYFNAVSAVAILIAFGLRQVVPPRYHPAAIVTFLLFMLSLNLLIYTQSLLPYWYLES